MISVIASWDQSFSIHTLLAAQGLNGSRKHSDHYMTLSLQWYFDYTLNHSQRPTMDLKQYSKKDIILSALKSEIDSERTYLELAKRVKNIMLADRLKFLAREEKNHAVFLKDLFKAEFPGEQAKVPDEGVIPLPEIDIENESIAMSDLLDQAKDTETVAATFYSSMISIFSDDKQQSPEAQQRLAKVRDSLLYLATMETGHARILETEAEHARQNEHDTMEWEMIHVGP